MEPADQRNLVVALVLFFALMIGYEFLISGPARKKQEDAKPRATTQQQTTQTNAPLSFKLRDDIVNADIAAGKRVLVDGLRSMVRSGSSARASTTFRSRASTTPSTPS